MLFSGLTYYNYYIKKNTKIYHITWEYVIIIKQNNDKAKNALEKYLKSNPQFEIEAKYYLNLISNNNPIKSIPYSIKQIHASKFSLLYNHLNNIVFEQIYRKLAKIDNNNLGKTLTIYTSSDGLAKKLHDKFQTYLP